MELMTISLDKFSKLVYCNLKQTFPEDFLGKVAVAVSTLVSLQGINDI